MDFFNVERIVNAYEKIVPYLINPTIGFSVVCLVFTTLLAFVIALIRLRNIPVIQQITGIYISFMRGTPILVQIMLVYYGLPKLVQFLFGINILKWQAIIFAAIAVILNEAAFFSEQIRGAILSVPSIQTEAAYSIGMTKMQTYRRIIIPQVVRMLIPPYGNVVLGIFMETSILYIVGINDMMSTANSVGKSTGHSLDGYIVVACIYIIFNLIIRVVFHFLEKKMQYGRSQ